MIAEYWQNSTQEQEASNQHKSKRPQTNTRARETSPRGLQESAAKSPDTLTEDQMRALHDDVVVGSCKPQQAASAVRLNSSWITRSIFSINSLINFVP